ncbi:hypothetical protein ACR6C2_03280 [Streptomyces sp. INA 01156]
MPTPSDPGPSHDGPPLEPVRVLRPRRTDALAEMFREFERERLGSTSPSPCPGRRPGRRRRHRNSRRSPRQASRRPRAGPAARRTAVAVAVAAAAVLGFGGAVLLLGLLGDHTDDRAAAAPRPSASPPVSAPAAPPEPGPARPGFLSEGDAGPR